MNGLLTKILVGTNVVVVTAAISWGVYVNRTMASQSVVTGHASAIRCLEDQLLLMDAKLTALVNGAKVTIDFRELEKARTELELRRVARERR